MGHIRRLDTSKYQARYRGTDGRERAKNFARKADAEAWITAGEASRLQGEWIDPRAGSILLATYAETWLGAKANLRPRTMVNVRGRLENHLLPRFGRRRLASIQPSEVREWVADLSRAGLAPETVKAIYLTLGQIMKTAQIDRLIGRSPCVGVELPKQATGEEMHFLTADQVGDLADAITPRFRALILTAAYAGMRAGELTALKRRRVNLQAGAIDVVEAMGEVGGVLVTGPTKTGKRRTLRVPPFLVDVLAQQMAEYPSSDYLFTATEGGPVRHRNFSARHFRPAVERAGLPDELRFHDLRHTCAALMIASGCHLQEVKTYLGHSSIRVTSDRYGHLFPKAAESIRDRLQETFQKAQTDRAADFLRIPEVNGKPALEPDPGH
jgi:integrase